MTAMYLDPEMHEIILDFCNESNKQLKQLESILFSLEEEIENTKLFEQFGQIIDRIMGAAKSLELSDMAIMCELGKTIGYKASQIDDVKLLNIVVAVLFDTVEICFKFTKKLELKSDMQIKDISTEAFVKRMKWLSEKFNHISRSSVAPAGEEKDLDQSNIDDLLKQLGL
jgi:chemotaxis protein histidine kinase CheA